MISCRLVPISNQKGVLFSGSPGIISVNRLIRCCFSSSCGVSTYKFNRYPSSQTRANNLSIEPNRMFTFAR